MAQLRISVDPEVEGFLAWFARHRLGGGDASRALKYLLDRGIQAEMERLRPDAEPPLGQAKP
ncbi:MAG: hypothetical protein AAF647_02250 [Pseudomonadota bacterium]